MAYNKVILMGRLTASPELRETLNGSSVVNFTLAVDRGFGEDKQTDFFPIVAWKGTAEAIAKYVDKGQQLLVSGQLQTRSWEDRDGNKRTTTEVLATEFSFCEVKKNGESISSKESQNGSQGQKTASETHQSILQEIEDNELPF